MKKLIFIFLLLPFALKAQTVDQVKLPGIISIISPPSTQTVKVNLTNSGNHTVLTDWNNLDMGTTSQALNNSLGVSSGITVAVSGASPGSDGPFSATGNADFPTPIINMEWFINSGEVVTFTFSGCGTSTYTVKTGAYDPSAGNPTSITVNGSTQSCNPDGTPAYLTFTGVIPVSGVITVSWTGTAGNPILNGIILN